jgi:transposase
MARPYPKEFRDDVVRVARNREDGVTIEQIAADFGVHPMTLSKWMRQADIDEGSTGQDDRRVSRATRATSPETGCWSRKMRCCAGRRRICRSPICREKALPAPQRARR